MDILTIDFETAYSTEYSLTKMSPAEYILDPRFECTGLAVKRNHDKAFWVEGNEVAEFFEDEPTDVMSVSHNALFDACICAWHYGWVPKLVCDTLGAARATRQHLLRSLALGSLAEHLGVGKKGTALANVKGMRLADIRARPNLYREHIEYGLNDCELCAGIFDKLVRSGELPFSELAIMDMVLKCAINPKFIVDVGMLNVALQEIQTEKERTLARAMLLGADGKSDLMSNDKFAELLRMHGVEPPTKISPVTGKTAYAFAKTDQAFLDLGEHPDLAIQSLVAARLGHKSTIEETRTQRFINIANLNWPGRGYTRELPVPLRYAAAHTHRLGGDWKMNLQNLGRKSVLRKALVAPEGYKVVAADESQIEARVNCTINQQEDMRLAFEQGRDVYAEFGTELYGYPVGKKETPDERFVAKQCILGLGYNLGHNKFHYTIPILSYNQTGVKIVISEEFAKQAVDTYRRKYHRITSSWRILNGMGIRSLMTGDTWAFGPVKFYKERIEGPGGLNLFYNDIHCVDGDGSDRGGYSEVFHVYAGQVKKIYGGMLLENIVQFLSRIIVMDAAVRIKARLGIELALQVHDELVFIVPDELVETTKQVMREELLRRPKWMPNLPLDCEIGVGQTYADAK